MVPSQFTVRQNQQDFVGRAGVRESLQLLAPTRSSPRLVTPTASDIRFRQGIPDGRLQKGLTARLIVLTEDPNRRAPIHGRPKAVQGVL